MKQEHRPQPFDFPAATRDQGVLNDRPDLGRVGAARSSGGAGSAAFIRNGMEVLEADGSLVSLVDSIENDSIRLVLGAEADSRHCYIPLSLVDGVDDARIILSRRGEQTFGIASEP